jgi:periplasmic glucans biosynthesis protein
VSTLPGAKMEGFGLVQRRRSFEFYADAEARYDARPTLWVEPVGDWGDGDIVLLEIPTENEYADNVAAYFRPRERLQPGTPRTFRYRLQWTGGEPSPALARTAATWVGAGRSAPDARQFVVDFTGDAAFASSAPAAQVTASAGEISAPHVAPLPDGAGWRLVFDFVPGEAGVAELRASLGSEQAPSTETWLYRWNQD